MTDNLSKKDREMIEMNEEDEMERVKAERARRHQQGRLEGTIVNILAVFIPSILVYWGMLEIGCIPTRPPIVAFLFMGIDVMLLVIIFELLRSIIVAEYFREEGERYGYV